MTDRRRGFARIQQLNACVSADLGYGFFFTSVGSFVLQFRGRLLYNVH